jgi:SAM-dependent methyltransferase
MKMTIRPCTAAVLLPLLLQLTACAGKNLPAPGAAAAPAGDHFEHRFEDAEAWAKRFDDPARDGWQKPGDVIALMKVEPGQTAADIGAGTGYFLRHLSAAVGEKGRVLGLDIEPSMVEYMKRRAGREGLKNVEARVIPGDDPSLPAGGVDRVLIVNTWHHIPAREAYVKKLAAGLAPGGAVFVVDFTKASPEGPPAEHRLPPGKVAAELRAGGLATEVLEDKLPRQYVVIGRRSS